MKNDIFGIENFNIIEDEENYYFFRALNMLDNKDIEENKILDENGNYIRIRTDRERWEESSDNRVAKYDENVTLSLEQVYDHIKMHYRKDTNCISLSSNANVSISYGRGFYKDKYVMVKIPKKEFGEKVINAGQYMLEEIEKRVDEYISSIKADSKMMETLSEIDDAKTPDEIKKAIEIRYTSKEELNLSKARLRKGITYRLPVARISSYQALNEQQSLEKNKIIAKLTLLERVGDMPPVIPHTANNNLLVQTIGNAYSSLELIHYGDIQKEDIIDLPKEIVDIFALLQQLETQEQQIVNDLKKEVIQFINEGRNIEIPENSSLLRKVNIRENITIEEMYELTNGKVEYGMANSIVRNMFYLAKGQSNARALAELLRGITKDNPKYERVIEYVENNGFEIQPEISTKQSNKGYRLSESVNLKLKAHEIGLVQQIKSLTDKEQREILENGGLSNVRDIMTSNFAQVQTQEKIARDEYYAEAIFSSYDWQKIGIEEFTVAERNNLLQRIINEYCVDLYKKLEGKGIDRKDIPIILLNIVTRKNDFGITEKDTSESIKEKRLEQYDRMLEENISGLNQELSIERIERFLGYYDIKGTGIQLRPYQQRAVERTDEIFEKERFASVILPTGAGKSFVALSQLMEHKDEEILYLAPQNEILEQMKDYIIKYIHGPVNTIGRTKEEIIADIFPNLKFSTYPGLLAKDGEEIVNKEYGFVVLDELHRTGATEWGDKLNALIDNQKEKTKVLGVTATPRRDADGKDMANEMAERLGYTNRDAISGKHIAMNMSLTDAIRMGLIVNPKLVSCAYTLKTDGSLDKLKAQIDQIEDVPKRNGKLEKYETLRRNLEAAKGITEILQSNVKKGGKYIVFLPIVDKIEDQDGNVIGRKKGRDKIADYEKQISEYFKGSDIKPNFHSMLGEYGDKDNARRLEEFQNRNTDETEFMLVMNKANEGLHLDKIDGIIWLRPLDENSRILYLQQLGRVIYSEDPDNPTKDEDRPVVIDLVNNTLKVNWDNEITEQDDIEMLNIIVDWVEKHDGTLPDINGNDKEESGYATILKEIQNKYKEHLDNNFDDLNERKIEEVQEILRLGSLIDLWHSELPEKIVKNGENYGKSFRNNYTYPFELSGFLKDFIDLEKETRIEQKTTCEEIIEFLETKKRMPRSAIIDKNNRKQKAFQMTEEQKYEVNLYARWNHWAKEKKILEEYREKTIEEVPEKYRESIARLRELGLGREIKTIEEKILEYVKNNGRLPRSSIRKNNRNAKRCEMSKEEKEEVALYQEWIQSELKKILDKYVDLSIEEIPEKYRKIISKLREIGQTGSKKTEKTTVEQIIEFIQTNGRLPRGTISKGNKTLKVEEMTKEQQEEKKLYNRWKRSSKEKKVLDEYEGRAIEEVPEEYRESISKLRELLREKTIAEQIIDFVIKNGRMPRARISGNGKALKSKEMTEEQLQEVNLYIGWRRRCAERVVLEEYIGRPIEEVPEEYRKIIGQLRELGISLEKRNVTEEFIEKLEKLEQIGVDITKIIQNDTIEKLAKKSGVNKKKLEEIGLNPSDKIGQSKACLSRAYGGKGTYVPPTKEQVQRLLELGISLELKRRTGKEIAETSISSLTDIEMSDREDEALKELVEKTKEGGIKIDEQS